MMKTKNNKKIKDVDWQSRIILAFGFALRIIAGLLANPLVNQHDITHRLGHYDYAMYLFMKHTLPNENAYELAQPPINALMQALCMKFFSLFKDYGKDYMSLYANCKYLSIIYSVITLYLIYKILKEFHLRSFIFHFVLVIIAFYPGFIVMATQYSNDGISYMFFFLSLYLGIKWCKDRKLSSIIKLAFAIGIGMLTKISVGLIAFILGPMMLAILFLDFKKNSNKSVVGDSQLNKGVGADCYASSLAMQQAAKQELGFQLNRGVGDDILSSRKPIHKSTLFQLIVFALIVFPIGLSYSTRNYILFDQPFGGIYEIAVDSSLDMKKYNYTFVDRFASFPVDGLVTEKYSIYHDMTEYNIWVDMIKTATYDEFDYQKDWIHPINVVLYILNIIFYFVSIIALLYNMVQIIKILINYVGADILSARGTTECHPLQKAPNYGVNVSLSLNLRIIGIMLFILALCSYLGFNMKYQYSCNSNWRYVAYITLGQAIVIAYMLNDLGAKVLAKPL